MLIPYNTDAPLYYFPYATIGLIVVNTLIFGACIQVDVEDVRPWILQFGNGLHPLQWISNNFLHAGPMHLIGNMFFLWGFGLVVEGKIGWWRFLAIYLIIGALYGAALQIAMLTSAGGALGASGVIFGLMVMSLIWAPKNEMNCVLWLVGLRWIDLPITLFATIYLVLQITFASLGGFSMSSEILHLTGAGIGGVFGVAMLKLGLVDCEGWDLFTVLRGKEGARAETIGQPAPRRDPYADTRPKPEFDTVHEFDTVPAFDTVQRSQFVAQALKNLIAADDAAGAAALYQRERAAHPDWNPSEPDLRGLIQSLHAKQLWSPSVRPMVDYLRRFPDKSVRLRLKLAQILLDAERRPARALQVLAKLNPQTLPADLQPIHHKLIAKAEQLQSECDLEVADDEEW